MVATVVARNANEAMVVLVVASGGVSLRRESAVKLWVLCYCAWQESGFNRRENVFTFNLLLKETVYVLCFQCSFL
jgi:hypothetical protein